jgi:hypothetical protein
MMLECQDAFTNHILSHSIKRKAETNSGAVLRTIVLDRAAAGSANTKTNMEKVDVFGAAHTNGDAFVVFPTNLGFGSTVIALLTCDRN